MIRYAIIIERAADGGYGAYVPDLQGCVGIGTTKEEVLENIAEAIELHIEGMKAEGMPIPPAVTEAENVFIRV